MPKSSKPKSPCPICGTLVANPNTKSHINSAKHKKALQKDSPSSVVSHSPQSSSNLESRVLNLEKQMDSIIKKIDNLELRFLHNSSSFKSSKSNSNIKSLILRSLTPGSSISIDELRNIPSLRSFDWDSIEQTVLSMIDEELLDVSEGSSQLKIDNKYGRIIIR